MRVRRRVTILECQNSRRIKQSLFFMAGKMGLSGWVTNLDNQVLGMELQGDERLVNGYIEKIITTFGISVDNLQCRAVKMDTTDDGSVKIG